MSLPQVTGAIWWRMGISHYQSLFRRARKGEARKGFTRDYLQASGIMPVLREMFDGREPPYEPLVYRWTAGAYTNGRIYPAADFDENERVEVGQFLGGIPPEPWQVGDPSSNPVITVPGDPGASIPDEAVAQWEQQIEPLQPWLLMIQLNRNQQEFHLRAYLERPSEGLAETALDHIPEQLRNLMLGNSRPGAGAAASALPNLWFDPSDFRHPWKSDPNAKPHAPDVALVPIPVSGFGASYQPEDETVQTSASEPFAVDPNQRDRSTQAHHRTQNELAQQIEARDLEPLSPKGEPDFDLAWEMPGGSIVVAEVKSITQKNAERQLRLGLGQVLRYRNLLQATGRQARALLALSDKPVDLRWVDLCMELDVGLIWRPNLADMLDEWLADG